MVHENFTLIFLKFHKKCVLLFYTVTLFTFLIIFDTQDIKICLCIILYIGKFEVQDPRAEPKNPI